MAECVRKYIRDKHKSLGKHLETFTGFMPKDPEAPASLLIENIGHKIDIQSIIQTEVERVEAVHILEMLETAQDIPSLVEDLHEHITGTQQKLLHQSGQHMIFNSTLEMGHLNLCRHAAMSSFYRELGFAQYVLKGLTSLAQEDPCEGGPRP